MIIMPENADEAALAFEFDVLANALASPFPKTAKLALFAASRICAACWR